MLLVRGMVRRMGIMNPSQLPPQPVFYAGHHFILIIKSPKMEKHTRKMKKRLSNQNVDQVAISFFTQRLKCTYLQKNSCSKFLKHVKTKSCLQTRYQYFHVFFIYNLQCVSPPKCNLKPEKDLLIKKCEGERIFLKRNFSYMYIFKLNFSSKTSQKMTEIVRHPKKSG